MPPNIKQGLWSQLRDPKSLSFKLYRHTKFAEVNGKRIVSGIWPTMKSEAPRKTVYRKSFSTGSILLLDFGPGGPASSTANVASTTKIERTICSSIPSPLICTSELAQNVWRRELHPGCGKRGRIITKRYKSSTPDNKNGQSSTAEKKNTSDVKMPKGTGREELSSSYLHLPHMPKLPHAPSKEELLSAATGFFSRMKVRFKWFSIRSSRPWNVDDWSAFISWFVLGNIAWVFIGTTTFFSLVIFSINTVVAQETLASWVGDYLTNSAGIKVVFESAIVPKWNDGVITFHNVFVSRRPGQGKSKVRKGSTIEAAAAAAAERYADQEANQEEEEDTNYTQFDVTINTVNVTLSFVKWWNGKGLLRDVEVKGVRGVVDRTSVHWGTEYVDPKTYRHEHHPGDFEIDSFKMEDLLVTLHQPKGFRPFSISIFSCELPQLRKQWLFYDFLSANNMSGAFDGSLFTIHPRQLHGFAGSHNPVDAPPCTGSGEPWKKHSRLRIDGLKIDHLNRGVDGLFGWIHEGNVDIVADVMFPADNDESIAKVMSDFYDRMEATVTSNRYMDILEKHPVNADLNTPEARAVSIENEKLSSNDDKRYLVMDLRVHLNDVRAAVPLLTRDLSYINQALIRPIVAYINSKNTFIPVNCRIVKRASEFDGSWTIFDSGLMEDLSAETYEAFAKNVMDSQARMRRLKKVGFWSISLAVQALFMGLAGNVV
ncbi:mitochondrial distribution and morphology protein-like protein 31 [Calycina marina]|uniref:Mitochondrial distribution and morphology protein-like protein 31 n=1 Tax=Calycina marina TaxID=1763456 RepID=A0A9P7Z829_9HELO|nr:mitochondrial distribution and morphology protein-like protein 31 [Calycina marina]